MSYGNYSVKSNYKFIPIKNPAQFYTIPESAKKNNGYMDLTCHTVTEMHIGSGLYGMADDTFSKLTEKVNGRFVIPGSSIKGCVRNIARIVSDGCVRKNKNDHIKLESFRDIKCNHDRHCIVCDIFGLIGQRSKVFFDDFEAPADTESITLKVQEGYSPGEKGFVKYNTKTYKGFKLYPTIQENNESNRKLMIEAIPIDTEFKGRIYFERLSNDELELLMFALGLDESFDLKIGGFKYDNMGDCYMTCDKLVLNGKEENNAKQIAEKYPERYGTKFLNSINNLRDILSP